MLLDNLFFDYSCRINLCNNLKSIMNEFTKEITEQLQAFIDEQAKRGHTPSMEELNIFVQKRANEQNTKPQDNFNGFSSAQIHHLINKPFEEGCPIQLSMLNDEVIEE